MDTANASISVLPGNRREDLLWESIPLITCDLTLPQIQGEGQGPRRIDRYYRHVENILLKALKGFHPQLCAIAEQALSASLPIPLCHVWTDYETAHLDERFLSIRWSLYGDGGTRHHCDLWELPWGVPMSAKVLLPKELHHKASSGPCLLRGDGVYLVGEDGEKLIYGFSQ